MVFDKDLGHDCLLSLAFAPDGKHVATGSSSGFLSLVETSSGEMVFDKDLGHDCLLSLAFAPKCRPTHVQEPRDAQFAVYQGDKRGSTAAHEVTHHVVHAEVTTAIDEAIHHIDSPTTIDAQEAAQFATEQHAGFIERNLGTIVDELTDYTDDGLEEELLLCKINRNSKQLRSELREGRSLQQCRDALDAHGVPWKHFSGALIFVHPPQYRMAMIGLKHTELHADHIVFVKSLEYLVEEAMSRCKSAWVKTRVEISSGSSEVATLGGEETEPVGEGSEAAEQLGWSEYAEIVVERTFITVVPRHASESVVTKSTTDAHLPRIANPRLSKNAM